MVIDPGMIALIIFGIMIILWCIDRLPMAFVAMAGCVACVALKVCALPKAMSGFTNDLVFLVAGMEIVGIALLKSGLASVVGRAVLKASKNDERRLMIISFCIAALMSAFMSNMAVVVFFLVIFRGVVKISNNVSLKNITIPVIAGAVTGGACTLIGSTPQLAGQAVIKNFQEMNAFKMFDFAPIGIPIVIVTGLMIYFYAYPHGKKMLARAAEKSEEAVAGATMLSPEKTAADDKEAINLLQSAADKKKLFIMAGISILMMVMMVTEFVSVGTAAMVAALLSVITGCVTQKQAFSEMNWNIIIWLAGCFGMAEIMSVSGGTGILTSAVASVVSEGMPPFLFFALVTLVCMVVSQLISNTACVLIFMPIFVSMAMAMGVSPLPIAMGVIYGSSLAYLTPLASAQIGLALTVGHSFREIVRYSLFVHVVMYIAAIIMIPLVFPL